MQRDSVRGDQQPPVAQHPAYYARDRAARSACDSQFLWSHPCFAQGYVFKRQDGCQPMGCRRWKSSQPLTTSTVPRALLAPGRPLGHP